MFQFNQANSTNSAHSHLETRRSDCGCRKHDDSPRECECQYPEGPKPDPVLSKKIADEMNRKHGAGASDVLLDNTHLRCSRSFSFIDRPFRDPDYSSLMELESQIKIIVFGVGSVENLIADFKRHELKPTEWDYTIIIPGPGPRLLANDLNTPFYQNMDESSGATGDLITDPLPKPTVVIKDAQTRLATLMTAGVKVTVCLNAVDAAYKQGVLLDPAISGNPTLRDQLFDSRIKFVTSGVGYAAELSAKGVKFWELH